MCNCRAVDRRSLLRGGIGAVSVAALMTFDPAAAGTVTRKVFRGEFTSPATPDWHYLPFRVPRGVRKIHVAYEYEPTDTGLGLSYNVVDLGIFDPSGHGLGDALGFRGWSGGARPEFAITRGWATPGYLPGPITPGVWHVLLGPYLIIPPGTPYKVVVSLHFGPQEARFVPAPAPQAVAGTGPGWYRGDLHLHTVHSDGKRTQPQLVTAARAAGLDFIGSSDHNTSAATYHWGRHVPDDFLVINGEEVTTRSGHWLAMGLPPMTWIDWRYRAEDDQLGRFTDRVHELGGIAIAAHPFNPVPSIRWDHGYDTGIDAIEAWNGPWTLDDQTTVEHWHDLLVSGRFIPIVGNSDSHTESQKVGLAQTSYRLAALSAAEVVAAVKGGHAWIAESSNVGLTFEATLGDRTVSCGDHLGAGEEDLVTVRLTASGVPGSLARILGPVGTLGFAVADEAGHLTAEVTVPAASAAFVRAEIGRPDDAVVSPVDDTPIVQMAALTNPIFLGSAG
ncbi:MAG TPA: CehA/McbA family metallohydrolase [Nocardioides sp.]|nr:CehA/McbA family metallohydrolase [Nocardioides sp.]